MISLPLEPGMFRTSRCSGKRGPKSESKGEAVEQTDNGGYFVHADAKPPDCKQEHVIETKTPSASD